MLFDSGKLQFTHFSQLHKHTDVNLEIYDFKYFAY